MSNLGPENLERLLGSLERPRHWPYTPQPQETHMDEIRTDPQTLQHLTYLYRTVYTTERAAGSDGEDALRLASEAIERVVAAARSSTLIPTTEQVPTYSDARSTLEDMIEQTAGQEPSDV